MPAVPRAVTGVVSDKDGKRWITAVKIEPTKLKYPDIMLSPDKPFAMSNKEPLFLKINEKMSLKCIRIPPGKSLMGTPFYMWPYFMEEYPHMVTLTKPFYMSEIPITQAMYLAVMDSNPSTVKNSQLPVQNPPFADVRKFCQVLSEQNQRVVACLRTRNGNMWPALVRLTRAFAEKYVDQNSSGPDGFKGDR